MLLNKTIWICGHRKSGTTLLSNLLDGHPEISTYGTDLRLIYAVYDTFENLDISSVNDRIIKLFLDDRIETEKLNLEHLLTALNSVNIKKKSDVFKLIKYFNNLLAQNGRPLFKETSSENYLNSIKAATVQPQFLHMVRDPRDNFAAISAGVKKYYSSFGEGHFESLASVINRINIGFSAFKMNKKIYDQYQFIKFENLVTKPAETIENICKYLGVNYSTKMLSPTKSGKAYKGNSHDGKVFNSVSDANVNRWSERITELDAQIIEATCESVMDYFEYKPQFTIREKSKALEYFYGKYNQRYFYYDKLGEI